MFCSHHFTVFLKFHEEPIQQALWNFKITVKWWQQAHWFAVAFNWAQSLWSKKSFWYISLPFFPINSHHLHVAFSTAVSEGVSEGGALFQWTWYQQGSSHPQRDIFSSNTPPVKSGNPAGEDYLTFEKISYIEAEVASWPVARPTPKRAWLFCGRGKFPAKNTSELAFAERWLFFSIPSWRDRVPSIQLKSGKND